MSVRPWVTVKYAQTLDGKIATVTGESQWITGEAARTCAHQLRAEHDAVLVGVGTVIADDPLLTVRHVSGQNPRRIVLDSGLRIPPHARLLHGGDQTTIVTTVGPRNERFQRMQERGARLITVPEEGGQVLLLAALASLYEDGIASVLIEGGAAVLNSVFAAQLADRVVVFIAPRIMGTGLEVASGLSVTRVASALEFRDRTWWECGDDMGFSGTPIWRGDAS